MTPESEQERPRREGEAEPEPERTREPLGPEPETEPVFTDHAPAREGSGAHEALEPAGELVFTDGAGGAPVVLAPDAATPAAATAPQGPAWQSAGAPSRPALGELGRVALPAKRANAPEVATAPCPHCQKPVPLDHARCTFCGRVLVKKEAPSPYDATGTAPGSPVTLATPAERIALPDYVPESLARELAAKDEHLTSERALAREASREKRRWLLRWAPLVISGPWLVVWLLATGSWSVTLVLLAVDLAGAWAIARWSIQRGGGAIPTVAATSAWVFLKIMAAAAKLGFSFFAIAIVPALLSVAMAALVGISIELEADELRDR